MCSDDSRLPPLRRLRSASNVDHMIRLDDAVRGTMMCGVITREAIDRNDCSGLIPFVLNAFNDGPTNSRSLLTGF